MAFPVAFPVVPVVSHRIPVVISAPQPVAFPVAFPVPEKPVPVPVAFPVVPVAVHHEQTLGLTNAFGILSDKGLVGIPHAVLTKVAEALPG